MRLIVCHRSLGDKGTRGWLAASGSVSQDGRSQQATQYVDDGGLGVQSGGIL